MVDKVKGGLALALREMVIANHGWPIHEQDEADPIARAALVVAREALTAWDKERGALDVGAK